MVCLTELRGFVLMKNALHQPRISFLRAQLPLALLLGFTLVVPVSAASSGETAFEAVKKLSGSWTGKDEDKQPVTATYEVSSGGSIVIEKLQTGTYPCMTSVYHRDGDGMMMTHYCNMNNQPRMRLKSHDPEKRIIDFDFVDITNLKSPKQGHIRKLTISLADDDHMTHDWGFSQDGKEAHTVFTFERVRQTYDPASEKSKPQTKDPESEKG